MPFITKAWQFSAAGGLGTSSGRRGIRHLIQFLLALSIVFCLGIKNLLLVPAEHLLRDAGSLLLSDLPCLLHHYRHHLDQVLAFGRFVKLDRLRSILLGEIFRVGGIEQRWEINLDEAIFQFGPDRRGDELRRICALQRQSLVSDQPEASFASRQY